MSKRTAAICLIVIVFVAAGGLEWMVKTVTLKTLELLIAAAGG